MNILLAVANFQFLTGAEIYVYELARELKKRGHTVAITSYIGGELEQRAKAEGIELYHFTYFNDKRLPWKPDIIHSQQEWPTQLMSDIYPDVPMVKTIHSWYETEKKFTHPKCRHYIYVHTETKPFLLEAGIPEDKMTLIRNGIDFERFNTNYEPNHNSRKIVLFAGTVDPFRKTSAEHLMAESQSRDFDIRFIGTRFDTYLDVMPANATHVDAIWNIEEEVKKCDETAGILFGRWLIEGWACGKPGTLYQVGQDGMIKDIQRMEVPKDMSEFDIKFMTDRIEKIYHDVLS